MKRFLLPLVALCLWAPNVHAQEKEKAPEPLIQEMGNGLQVQTYDIRNMRDDMAEMLGIYLWKIRFLTPQKGKYISVRLELRIPGEKPRQFSAFAEPSFEKSDYVFGIQPIDGDRIHSSPNTRIYSRRSFYQMAKEQKEPSDSRVSKNPFLNLGTPSVSYEPPVRADGSILLMTFWPNPLIDEDDPKNSELVVVATLQDPPPAK